MRALVLLGIVVHNEDWDLSPSHFPSSFNANDVFKFPEVMQKQGSESQLDVVLLPGELQSEMDCATSQTKLTPFVMSFGS
jgi:hypothetical protein